MTQIDDAATVRGRCSDHLGVDDALHAKQPDQVVPTSGEHLGRQPICLVQDHDRHSVLGREPGDVLLVQTRIGILLGVGHPDEDVDQVEQAVGLQAVGLLVGVEVGQIQQHQPVELKSGRGPIRRVARLLRGIGADVGTLGAGTLDVGILCIGILCIGRPFVHHVTGADLEPVEQR